MKRLAGFVLVPIVSIFIVLGGCGSGGSHSLDRENQTVSSVREVVAVGSVAQAEIVIITNDSDPDHHLRVSRQEDPDNWDAPNPELIRRDGRIYYYGLALPMGAHYQFELMAFPNYSSSPIVPLDLTQPVATPAQIELYYEEDPESAQE